MLSLKLALIAGLTGALLPVTASVAQVPTRAPTRPMAPSAPAIDPAICTDPARRAPLIADGERDADLARARVDAGVAYTQELIAWRGAQLVRSGRWTDAQREAFERGLRENPEIRQAVEAMQAAARDATAAIAAGFGGAEPAVAHCRAFIAFRGFENRMFALAEAQWRAIDAAYAAEARRLGVSID